MSSTRTFRDQKAKEQDEDILKGKLPAGFSGEGSDPVTHVLALQLIGRRHQNAGGAIPPLPIEKESISKAIAYLETFKGPDIYSEALAKQNEIHRIHHMLGLTDFEIAQLQTMRPRDWEEARSLIGSLERLDTDEQIAALEEVIALINRPSLATGREDMDF